MVEIRPQAPASNEADSGLPVQGEYTHIIHDIRCRCTSPTEPPRPPADPPQPVNYAIGICPSHILDAAMLLETLDQDIRSNPYAFYEFWGTILSHFFPRDDGFTIEEDWGVPETGSFGEDKEYVPFAVFPPKADSPSVLVQIHSQHEFSNCLLRETAMSGASHLFDLIAPYSPHEHILVITAMGQSWRGLHGTVYLTSGEASQRWAQDSRTTYASCEWFDSAVNYVGWEYLEGMMQKERKRGLESLYKTSSWNST